MMYDRISSSLDAMAKRLNMIRSVMKTVNIKEDKHSQDIVYARICVDYWMVSRLIRSSEILPMTGISITCLLNINYFQGYFQVLYSQVTVAVDVTMTPSSPSLSTTKHTFSNKKCLNRYVSWVLWKDTKDGSPPSQPHLKTRI